MLRKMGRDDSTNCSGAHKLLNGLCVECYVAVFTIVDLLCISTEIIIQYDVIKDPNNDQSSGVHGNSSDHEPGGTCRYCTMDNAISITHCATHYASVAIACIFMIEIMIRLIVGCPGCWKDALQVFDGVIVLAYCAMELLFSVFWAEVLCYNKAIEIASFVVIFRLCRIPRACGVRKRNYAERLENEMHYLRKAKSKSEEHSRELTTKLKRQQREIYELQNRLSTISMTSGTYSNENLSSISVSDMSTPPISNGTLPNGFLPMNTDDLSIPVPPPHPVIPATIDEVDGNQEQVSRQNSVQYNSLLSEINSKREQIHNKSLKRAKLQDSHYMSPTDSDRTSAIYSNVNECVYSNVANNPDVIDRERTGFPQDSADTDIVFQLEKIVKNNQGNGGTETSRSSAQSFETDDDEAMLIRRSYHSQSNKTRASFSGRENKAFTPGQKTRASFSARDNRSKLSTLPANISEEVKMRNLEIMAEYEGTRTYKSAEGIPLTDL